MSALDIIVVIAWFTMLGLAAYAYGWYTHWRQEKRDNKQPQFYTYEADPARWMAEYREWKDRQ